MANTVAWHRAVGGAFNGARQFILDTGAVFGAGVHLGRFRLTVDLITNLGGNNVGAPTASAMVMAGVRLGIDDTTPPGADPRSNPTSVDWLGVEFLPPVLVPRSTVNGWDLHQMTPTTIEWNAARVTTGSAKRLWVICSPVAVPAVTFWAGAAYLEVQYWTA